ncbi:MAG: hypothetical protein QNJ46_13350 [Leptolyngbyaceae cyanobacterium MO_188.B28]|nr:hypothetical protein [Leptolyngbyaceae cyanobacterium MO_188.B28]
MRMSRAFSHLRLQADPLAHKVIDDYTNRITPTPGYQLKAGNY